MTRLPVAATGTLISATSRVSCQRATPRRRRRTRSDRHARSRALPARELGDLGVDVLHVADRVAVALNQTVFAVPHRRLAPAVAAEIGRRDRAVCCFPPRSLVRPATPAGGPMPPGARRRHRAGTSPFPESRTATRRSRSGPRGPRSDAAPLGRRRPRQSLPATPSSRASATPQPRRRKPIRSSSSSSRLLPVARRDGHPRRADHEPAILHVHIAWLHVPGQIPPAGSGAAAGSCGRRRARWSPARPRPARPAACRRAWRRRGRSASRRGRGRAGSGGESPAAPRRSRGRRRSQDIARSTRSIPSGTTRTVSGRSGASVITAGIRAGGSATQLGAPKLALHLPQAADGRLVETEAPEGREAVVDR